MPIVTFLPAGRTIEVPTGTSLFDAAVQAGLPVASSCGADSVCGKCNMQVIAGVENLSSLSEPELRLLRRDKRPSSDRISCQTRVTGDCTVTTTYW